MLGANYGDISALGSFLLSFSFFAICLNHFWHCFVCWGISLGGEERQMERKMREEWIILLSRRNCASLLWLLTENLITKQGNKAWRFVRYLWHHSHRCCVSPNQLFLLCPLKGLGVPLLTISSVRIKSRCLPVVRKSGWLCICMKAWVSLCNRWLQWSWNTSMEFTEWGWETPKDFMARHGLTIDLQRGLLDSNICALVFLPRYCRVCC